MKKVILLTGATDGIGLETAKILLQQGHHVLLHGRNPDKLETVKNALSGTGNEDGDIEGYIADLSDMQAVCDLAKTIAEKHNRLDVLINNAGVLKATETLTKDGLDIRFAVNTIAPYLLTKKLLPLLTGKASRVINLSSAAQSPVNIDALTGHVSGLSAMEAYAQSKLAITMWSRTLPQSLKENAPTIIAVNPGSLLASKMVKEGFGVDGHDLKIGANILVKAALANDFAGASGQYFDNDAGHFSEPHPDALDDTKSQAAQEAIEKILSKMGHM